jgi:hypothetical protein
MTSSRVKSLVSLRFFLKSAAFTLLPHARHPSTRHIKVAQHIFWSFAHAGQLVTMSGSSGPRKSGVNNNEMNRPSDSIAPNRPDLPRIAVPPSTKVAMEEAFLVTKDELATVIRSLVTGSTTLQA